VDGQDRASIGHFAITPSYFPESTRSTRIGPARTTHRRREGDFAGKHRCGRPLAGDDHRPRSCPRPRTAASLPHLRAGSLRHPSSAAERRRAAGRPRLRQHFWGHTASLEDVSSYWSSRRRRPACRAAACSLHYRKRSLYRELCSVPRARSKALGTGTLCREQKIELSA
jgi:hypothetical protein